MADDQTLAGALSAALSQMNNHINQHGQIKPSSQVIKDWHNWDNAIWQAVLTAAKVLGDANLIRLPYHTTRDIEFLLEHINRCYTMTDNVLYPSIKETNSLPDAVTHTNLAKHERTIKSRTFRTMMNVREALCATLDIDLPNDDSSMGKLNAKPKDQLFDFH